MHETSTGLTSGSVQQENSLQMEGGLTHISPLDISYFAFNFASKVVELYPLSSSFFSLDSILGWWLVVPSLCLLSWGAEGTCWLGAQGAPCSEGPACRGLSVCRGPEMSCSEKVAWFLLSEFRFRGKLSLSRTARPTKHMTEK